MLKKTCLLTFMLLTTACSTTAQKKSSITTVIERKTGIQLDKQEVARIQKRSPATLEKIKDAQPLSVDDIIALVEVGINDRFIIEYRKESLAKYNLRYVDLVRLQQAGVSQQVIHDMVNTGR